MLGDSVASFNTDTETFFEVLDYSFSLALLFKARIEEVMQIINELTFTLLGVFFLRNI